MPIRDMLDDVPESISAYLDIARLRRDAAAGDLHTTFWLAVSVALWYRSVYV